jgi:hypothetical protein
MSATPESTLPDPHQIIANLRRATRRAAGGLVSRAARTLQAPAMDEPRVFGAIRRLRLGPQCIEASLAICAYLHRHGISAEPASVSVGIDGRLVRPAAWSLAPGVWAGHLVAISNRWVIDATAGQFDGLPPVLIARRTAHAGRAFARRRARCLLGSGARSSLEVVAGGSGRRMSTHRRGVVGKPELSGLRSLWLCHMA